jgi:hypothetical protein
MIRGMIGLLLDALSAGRTAALCRLLVLETVKAAFRPLAPNTRCWTAGGIAWLPSTPKCRLVLVGAGHVAQAVAALASDLDFDVWVVDDREDYASGSRFPSASRRIVGAIGRVLVELDIDSDTDCSSLTVPTLRPSSRRGTPKLAGAIRCCFLGPWRATFIGWRPANRFAVCSIGTPCVPSIRPTRTQCAMWIRRATISASCSVSHARNHSFPTNEQHVRFPWRSFFVAVLRLFRHTGNSYTVGGVFPDRHFR